MSTTIRIDYQQAGDRGAVLAVNGSLDDRGFPKFREALETAVASGITKLLLDFSGTDYANSSAWAAIISFNQLARRKGGKLVIAGMGENLRSTFDILNLKDFLDVAGSAETARTDLLGAG